MCLLSHPEAIALRSRNKDVGDDAPSDHCGRSQEKGKDCVPGSIPQRCATNNGLEAGVRGTRSRSEGIYDMDQHGVGSGDQIFNNR